MRFPRINRLRWDKPPGEADRLETLERMLEKIETERGVSRALRNRTSKYPPAKPGALLMGPLKAAVAVANATPVSLGHLKVAVQRHRFS
jgi:hypothetical protein